MRRPRFTREEISGSLGDLGTFIPLLVGMVTICNLHPAHALFFAGAFNILTGLLFGIPMAVQPMKAIATIAIASRLRLPAIMAGGVLTSLIILILGLSGLLDFLNRAIPKPVIRGLQLALGLQLAITGVEMVAGTGKALGYDSIVTGIVSLLLLLFLFFSRKIPAALIIFIFGLILLFLKEPGIVSSLSLSLTIPSLSMPSLSDFKEGMLKLAIPQIPLTLLNSVFAVSALSYDLFGEKGAPVKKVAVSVGTMNLVACLFGGMPMCHGSGGLAGQYRFGARTGGSVIFLGIVKILLGIVAGGATLILLKAYPASVLGILLLLSGLELAIVTRDISSRADAFTMLMTAGVILALRSPAIGFLAGWILARLFLMGLVRMEEPG